MVSRALQHSKSFDCCKTRQLLKNGMVVIGVVPCAVKNSSRLVSLIHSCIIQSNKN